jgi:hypothetical protein
MTMKANPLLIGFVGLVSMVTGVGSLGLAAFFAIGAASNSYLAVVLAALLWTAYFLLSRGFRLIYSVSGVMTPEDLEEASLEAKSVEDRLDELERLKRRDLVTPEEYAAKRQEILNDL